MSKQGLFWLLAAAASVAILVGASTLHHMAEGKRYAVTMFTYNVGRELINTTNSSFLAAVSPELQASLSQLLVSTTHIASVRLGDEPAPVGDGRASSRVVLTNEQAQGLGIRLHLRSSPTRESKFEVLSFWRISEPSGAANGSQPFSLDTNRASSAAGSRR